MNAKFGKNFGVVDFEALDDISTEAVPDDQRQRMNRFSIRGTSHRDLATPTLHGYMVLKLPEKWGVTLQENLFEKQLGQLLADLQRYTRVHPEEQSFVRELVELNAPLRQGASSYEDAGIVE